mmetsp:Transcript_60612/g.128369  ORF Transcript_60612/g.128369 Transcript_60612/m.128369 type:complete len:254 (-) Transcript_60612:7-768(-)
MSACSCVRPAKSKPSVGCCEKQCQEPNGCIEADPVTKTTYRQVEEGRGQYEMVPQYNFVGSNEGDYAKVGIERSQVSQALQRKIFASLGCAGLLLALLGIWALVSLLRPSQSPNLDYLSAPFSCGAAGLQGQALQLQVESWSDAHRQWCCMNRNRGCQSTTEALYDCQASLGDWQAGWAESKKAWCCEHTGTGCPQTTTQAYDCSGQDSDWSFGRRYWCCWNANRGCNDQTGRNFDANAPTSPGQAGVSVPVV